MARKYVQRIDVLYGARRFEDLWAIQSLRLHPLKGEREGRYSLYLIGRWRLLIRRLNGDGVRVEEVSRHYGD